MKKGNKEVSFVSEVSVEFTKNRPFEGNEMNRGLDEWRNSLLHDKDYSSNHLLRYSSKKRAATRIIRGVGGVMSDRHLAGWVSFADTAPYRKFGFTLAEVLITLGIIGVVAAVTMPVFINNIKYKSYDNAKRKILNSVGEAGRLLAIEGDITGAGDAEDFVKNRLARKLSIAKMCDSEHLTDCGLPAKFFKTDGKTEMDMPTVMKNGTGSTSVFSGSAEAKLYRDKNSYGFVTGNGYSVNLFYNGACEPDVKNKTEYSDSYYILNQMCFFAIYDMNGQRGPNVVGKDIGLVGVFYPDEETRAVAVLPADDDCSGGVVFNKAAQACDDQFGKDYRLPDRDELALMALASNLLNTSMISYWSSTTVGRHAWRQNIGRRQVYRTYYSCSVRCIRR